MELVVRFPGVFCFLSVFCSGKAFSKNIVFDEDVHQFINNYCIRCHGIDEEKGDRTFHELSSLVNDKRLIDLGNTDKVNLLQDILDQLNLGEMPPGKKMWINPRRSEIQKSISWLSKPCSNWKKTEAKQTVLRRLNRREYRNTMRDLLGLNDLPFDLTQNFPSDENDHGFVNIGDALNLSDQHLDAYLEAADRYLRMAFRFEESKEPEIQIIKPKDWGYPEKQDKTPGCTACINRQVS